MAAPGYLFDIYAISFGLVLGLIVALVCVIHYLVAKHEDYPMDDYEKKQQRPWSTFGGRRWE